MLSFWEKESLISADYVVIGGGIVGLSAAISLAEAAPRARVIVAERGILPTGASTRNAGFACFGSLTEILADLRLMPAAEVQQLVALRYEGLQQLRSRLTDQAIGYEPLGGYELISEKELPALEHLEEVNKLLEPVLGTYAFSVEAEPARFGFHGQFVKAIVHNKLEGQLHTGAMMNALWSLAQQKGVRILTGCEISGMEEDAGGVQLQIESKLSPMYLRAGAVAVCNNAFVRNILPELDVVPGRGQVLITEPVAKLPFRGAFHIDEGYYYFRNVGDRVLLGGGRNIDFKGEQSTELACTAPVMERLKYYLQHVILPDRKVEVAQSWAGIMAFGASKKPILKRYGNSGQIVTGVRMGGMGVAIGTQVGAQLAQMLLEPSYKAAL